MSAVFAVLAQNIACIHFPFTYYILEQGPVVRECELIAARKLIVLFLIAQL